MLCIEIDCKQRSGTLIWLHHSFIEMHCVYNNLSAAVLSCFIYCTLLSCLFEAFFSRLLRLPGLIFSFSLFLVGQHVLPLLYYYALVYHASLSQAGLIRIVSALASVFSRRGLCLRWAGWSEAPGAVPRDASYLFDLRVFVVFCWLFMSLACLVEHRTADLMYVDGSSEARGTRWGVRCSIDLPHVYVVLDVRCWMFAETRPYK